MLQNGIFDPEKILTLKKHSQNFFEKNLPKSSKNLLNNFKKSNKKFKKRFEKRFRNIFDENLFFRFLKILCEDIIF